MDLVRQGPGRPRKYGRPSRAVTVTLPEDVLARLGAVDSDLGRAIVEIVEGTRQRRAREAASAEIATYGTRSVIVVTPVRALKRLRGVQLVPVGNGRALISLDHSPSIPRLELEIRDAIEHGAMTGCEKRTLEAIADILSRARRSRRIVLEERTIIVLEAKRLRRAIR